MSKKYRDPFAKREAKKYEFPIPSREFILDYLQEFGQPATLAKLISAFELELPEEHDGLRFRLKAMLRDGQLMTDRRRRYCLMNKVELIPGTVAGHPDGFGFVDPDDGGDGLYISARQMQRVFHGDRVLVREQGKDRRGRREGIIHEVIERNTNHIVGRLFLEKGIAFVEPDHKRVTHDIHIPLDELSGAKQSQIVMVEIVAQPSQHAHPIGRVVEILGDHMAPGMEIDIAIRSHEIPYGWPREMESELEQLPDEVTARDIKGRADIRNLALVTIDGEDARDFDDAVYCEKRPKGGWRLIVAIADVGYYVKPNTILDEEARNRGNSVYFPERVIPMLPEKLSNGLCSLNPHVDRLCMVCEMTISEEGKLTRSNFYEAVMHSHARMTYTEVAGILENEDGEYRKKYAKLLPHILTLQELYRVLHRNRQKRGALDFDTTETRIVFGEDKKITKIVPVIRNDAHRLIEECMLMANVSSARFAQRNKLPVFYRDHLPPPEEKLSDLHDFLKELGLSLSGGKKPTAGDFSKVIDASRERPDAHLIQTVLLRSLSQAVYSEKNHGHFALAYSMYTHFTSPIRRYPDLVLHRAIRKVLQHKTVSASEKQQSELHKLGIHCSQTERRADEATRNAIEWLKCEFMLEKVGETLPGVITAVTNFGVFVELKDIYVEGLVHVTALHNDYYQFDSVRHRLRGERTGVTYRLGDGINVQVVRVDLDERQIDFELA